MRGLSTLVVAAVAAAAFPIGVDAQLTAPSTESASRASLARCQWQAIGQFPKLQPRGIAIGEDGSLLLAADEPGVGGRTLMVILRRPAHGGAWEEVDRFLPAGATSTGARALHVDDDGNVFALAWEARGNNPVLTLRRSFGDGTAGTWETAETHWPLQPGGALASDPSGRVYVAYGFAGPSGIGWRVESALRGIGAFSVENETRVTGFDGASPQDLERTANGTLLVAVQLDGNPDEWIVRSRPVLGNGRTLPWRTIDRYQLTRDAYGLAPRAVVSTDDGALLVAGLGVRGGGSDDYRWIERWRSPRGKWRTAAFQLATGMHSFAQDAAATRNGVAVLGVGYTATGGRLVLRETTNGGATWRTALQVSDVTDPWSARLAVGGSTAAVTAAIQGAATVLACLR
jgi:hypothetical protein